LAGLISKRFFILCSFNLFHIHEDSITVGYAITSKLDITPQEASIYQRCGLEVEV